MQFSSRRVEHQAGIVYPQIMNDHHLAVKSPVDLPCPRARARPFRALALIGILLIAGCAVSPVNPRWMQPQSAALRDQLLQLDRRVDAAEAARLANAAVQQSAALADRYRAVRPAWFQNILVNGGLRERGLCYQWANDLYPRLHELGLKSLELHLAVARMDTPHEHNCIVVTARRQAFAQGVVLDAWRHSGRLWFGGVATDKYPWQPLPRERVAPELEKILNN